MRLLFIPIFLAALIQSSVLPINLVAVILTAQAYQHRTETVYYLAMIGGLFLGLLGSINLGIYPLILLVFVQLILFVRMLDFTQRLWLAWPLILVAIVGLNYAEVWALGHQFQIWKVVAESLLWIPLVWFLQFWNRHFEVNQIRLRIK